MDSAFAVMQSHVPHFLDNPKKWQARNLTSCRLPWSHVVAVRCHVLVVPEWRARLTVRGREAWQTPRVCVCVCLSGTCEQHVEYLQPLTPSDLHSVQAFSISKQPFNLQATLPSGSGPARAVAAADSRHRPSSTLFPAATLQPRLPRTPSNPSTLCTACLRPHQLFATAGMCDQCGSDRIKVVGYPQGLCGETHGTVCTVRNGPFLEGKKRKTV